MQSNKITAKDLINVGIFSAIYFVLLFVSSMVGFIPILLLLLPVICPIVTGIPFMLYLTKVHTFGQITLMGIVLGLANLLIGDNWLIILFATGFGLLADLICKAGKYRSSKLNIVGYGVFGMWVVGKAMPMYIMRDSYFQLMRSGYGNEYTDAILKLTPAWTLPLWFVLGFLGGVLGGLLGKAVLKKHFERAGIA